MDVFEWDKRPICNHYAAIRRHLNCVASPNDLMNFTSFSKFFFDDVIPRLLQELENNQIESFSEYPPRAFSD